MWDIEIDINLGLARCAGKWIGFSGEMFYPGLAMQCAASPFPLIPFPIHMGTGK